MNEPSSYLPGWVSQRDLLSCYDRSLARRAAPHLGTRLLEVGCGTGSMTTHFLRRELVVAADLNTACIHALRARLGGVPNLIPLNLDITSPGQDLTAFRLDSAICSNVLEHIEDDQLALQQIARALPAGGRMVVLVPAHPSLFCDLDRKMGHFRRYTAAGLSRCLEHAGFSSVETSYLNPLGAAGWLVAGRLLGLNRISDWQLRLFDRFASSPRLIEGYIPSNFGLTIFAVAVRK